VAGKPANTVMRHKALSTSSNAKKHNSVQNSWLQNWFDNRLKEQALFIQLLVKPGCPTGCIHDTAGCQTGCTTALTNSQCSSNRLSKRVV